MVKNDTKFDGDILRSHVLEARRSSVADGQVGLGHYDFLLMYAWSL